MSGDLIWVRGGGGRLVRELELPDVCGDGHEGAIYAQQSNCPHCNRPTLVFRCRWGNYSCHWVAATQGHYDRECTPDAPVWMAQPRGGPS